MATVVPGLGQSRTLFPDAAPAVAELRRDQLMMALRTVMPGLVLDDGYIYQSLLAAESELSHRLKCYFVPTTIIPDDAPQSELDALEAAGIWWRQEAAYDYGPELWTGESWGFIVTKSKPIISVSSIRYVYPNPTQTFYNIPNDWIRLDRKYGHIRLVPASAAFSAPLNAFLMQAIGGGRNIPMMVQVRYVAGLKDAYADYPDLVRLIKRLAVYNIVSESWVPQSGSISADGLSQSMSMDLSKYGEMIEEKIEGGKGSNGGLMAQIHGIRMGVL